MKQIDVCDTLSTFYELFKNMNEVNELAFGICSMSFHPEKSTVS